MRIIGLFLFVMLFSNNSIAQTPIYLEDFTGQAGKGAIGPGGNNPIVDVTGVDWSMDLSNVNLVNNLDYFNVLSVAGNELFEGRDIDNTAIWFSPVINLDGFIDVGFTIDVSESNNLAGNNLEDNDIILVEYRLDNGSWLQASSNGALSNDYDPTTVSQTGLNGLTLEIRVSITNNGGGERMRFDNVEVTGTSCIASVPFSEGFEDTTFPPTCWTSFRGLNGIGTGFDWERSTTANSGGGSAFVRYENVTGGNAQDWLVTPPIDLGASPTQLSFFGRQEFTAEYSTNYSIRISTTSQSDINSFTSLVSYTESDFGLTFSEKIVNLSAYTGVVYIAFVMEQDDGDNWYIDDITIDELPPCTVPDDITNLSANFTDSSVELSWNLGLCYDELLIVGKEGSPVTSTPIGDGSLYTANADFGSGTEIVTDEFVVYKGVGNGTTINNLVAGITYHFEVFTRKGTSWNSGVVIEVTGASCTIPVPFLEGFEDPTFLPDCWASFRGTNGLGTGFDWERSTASANTGVASAFVRYEDVTEGSAAQDWLVTPPLDLGSSPTQLSFFGRQQFTNEWNTKYTVRVSTTSQTDISSFTTLVTYTESDIGLSFSQKIVDLSAYTGVVYIAFVMEQDDGDNWYIDDISVDELPPCTVPDNISNLSADYVNGSIDLSWSLGSCYDELLIVAKDGSAVTAIPMGDGSLYSGNVNFGSGTEIVPNEFVVYKGGGNGITINNVSFGSTYHFEVFTRKGTNWSAGVSTNITLDCTVAGDTSSGRYITQVGFGSLNNASGAGPGYSDFTQSVPAPEVRRGDTETLSVSVNTNGSSFFGVHAFIWIDWNQDGIFSIATEQYDLGDANDGGPTNLAPNITIPPDAVLGETVMRVICRDRINPDGPCEDVSDGEIEDYAINVLDAIDYTYDNGWLPENPNGVATIASDIIVQTGDAIISSNTSCNTFTVNPGATLTVNTGATLTVADLDRGLTLESNSTQYSSLILDGNIEGPVNYERFVNIAGTTGSSGGNDLISAPLLPSSGQTFDEFINLGTPSNASKLFTNGILYAFAPYNTTTKSFENFTVDATTAITPGVGYRVATNIGENLTFRGDALSGDVLGIPVSRPVNGSQWNLIGNPYPSYINSLAFVAANASVIDDTGEAIYGYNSGTFTGSGTLNNYTIINNLTNSSVNIAPGQGFFIPVNNTPGFNDSVDFTSAMRTLVGSNDFILNRNPTNPLNLRLKLTSGNNERFTDIYFHENSSKGLDPGYDAAAFGGSANGFAIFSHLIEDNFGVDFTIQALHLDDMEEAVIPLGINANQGNAFSIEIASSNLPLDVDIYLQDTFNNTFTLLNNSRYNLSPSTNLSGTGRYFLVTSRNALSLRDKNLLGIEIYTNFKEIIIKGSLNSETRVELFDLQGRKILDQKLNPNKTENVINGSALTDGIYVVSLMNNFGIRSQKIILR